ncbi:MAG: ferritin family protein [Nitrospinae bacterium]|nr:ferritin family protein [Nitrospinota bacterium]
MKITDTGILEISLKIEREGGEFYNKLAEHVADPKIKEFLLHLAKDEAQHEKQFKKMLREKGSSLYGWEKKKAIHKLIESQFQTDIFPKVNEIFARLPNFQGIQKAIDFAIEAERTSAEFYSLLGEFCDNIKAKTLLVMMEKAERDHLTQVLALKKQYLHDSRKKSKSS